MGDPEKDAKIYDSIVRSMEVAAILAAKIIVVHLVQHLTYAEYPQELYQGTLTFMCTIGKFLVSSQCSNDDYTQ